ncbi:hypothetical protein ACIKT0_03230 [Hansschlegelia beijingensis]|uniref:hypothetical protein n=1 Tax=Hansschlegelia beijingensis TaxID=1133344 RepID=UPI00387F1E3F
MRLYRQILISACCVAPLALASGASAACLDEVEKLSAQVQSHQTPPKGPPATRTANDPEPPAHAKGDTAEKARGNQDQGAASGKSEADPRASASGGTEESQTGVTTGPGVVMGDAGPADAAMHPASSPCACLARASASSMPASAGPGAWRSSRR